MTSLNSLLSIMLMSNITSQDLTNSTKLLPLPQTSYEKDFGQPLVLTPYIHQGKIDRARLLSKVGKLPNAPDILSYSGYITVNKKHNSNMFYWFFPALNNNTKAPVILWLQGGPGAPGLFGLFVIQGPYIIRNNLTAELRPHTWAKKYHIIYVDNPVGTGFSFTGTEDGYVKNQEEMAEDLYEFLQQFFKIHHEYGANDLYVAGESYGGKYAPSIAYKIHVAGPPASVTFKGIAIGNGLCDPETQMDYADYYYQLGIIDHKQAAVYRNVSNQIVQLIRNEQYEEANVLFNNIVPDVASEANPNYLLMFSGYEYTYNMLFTKNPTDGSYFQKYIESSEFRKAVHVGNLSFDVSDKVRSYLIKDIMQSIKSKLIVIMEHYKVLIYNGQLDLTLPYPLMVNFLNTLEWRLSNEFKEANRQIWKLDGKDVVAGYVHKVRDFTLALVRSSGHMVPRDQPEVAFDLIDRFIQGKPYS